jgi:hypothetical protein
MQRAATILVAGLLLACVTAVDAQVHLHGRVIDDASEEPIAGATVTLVDTRGRRLDRRVTDGSGGFHFEIDRGRNVRLLAERVGYRRTTTPPFDLGGYLALRVEVRMDVDAVLLAPLEVIARSRTTPSPTLAGFEARRTSGVGWYLSREEIQRRGSIQRVSDLLLAAPGLQVSRRVVFMGRAASCPAQLYVDGFHINRSLRSTVGRRSVSTSEMFPIDDLVTPDAVEGIEVYNGLSRVPPEFLTPEAACGVVAIWTRRGN